MDFQRVDDGKLLLNIPEADNINHIVIFLTGSIPLPAGLAGAVYFSWPDPNAPPNWQFLGKLTSNCHFVGFSAQFNHFASFQGTYRTISHRQFSKYRL